MIDAVYTDEEKSKKYYAGVGSRETPSDIQKIMTQVASILEKHGYILRSGGADGADLAFENGVVNKENKEIYLPYRGFNGSTSDLVLDELSNGPLCYAFKDYFHPYPPALKWKKSKQLMSRNTYQVLGKDLHTFSDVVICWTEGGNPNKGGTAQALRLAKFFDIDIINLGHPEGREKLKQFLNKVMQNEKYISSSNN
jgi:hypothetical protein